jgi:hypothetical protein
LHNTPWRLLTHVFGYFKLTAIKSYPHIERLNPNCCNEAKAKGGSCKISWGKPFALSPVVCWCELWNILTPHCK